VITFLEAECVPALLLTGYEFHSVENIQNSVMTEMGNDIVKGVRLLIYQESPEISGIYLFFLGSGLCILDS
jgi:hypothetical protein